MSEQSTELERIDRRAPAMLREVKHEQYREYLKDPRVKEAVTDLVRRSAVADQELSPATIDYAIESFGRHGLSEEEYAVLTGGDIATMQPAEADVTSRRVHVALELVNSELDIGQGVDRIQEVAQRRLAIAGAISETVAMVEKLAGEEYDEQALLQLAVEYRQQLIIEGSELKNDHSLLDLADANEKDLATFLANRYSQKPEPKS